MTPQLRQAIRLLQMNAQELDVFIDQETEQNPFLQKEGDVDADEPLSDAAEDDFSELSGRDELPVLCDVASDEAPPESTGEITEDSFYEQAAEPSFEPETDFSADVWRGLSGGADDDGFRAVDICPAGPVSFAETLMRQARMAFSDEKQRLLAENFIAELDENGFLPADIGFLMKKGENDLFFDSVLAKVKTFEPTGVFSQSLPEFFERQLRERGRFDPAMAVMVARLDLVAAKKYDELSKICGVDMQDVADMIAELRSLNPRPTAGFDAGPAVSIVPDVLVRQDAAGVYHVALNDAALPRLLINRRYAAEIKDLAGTDKAVKKFYTEKMGDASFLIRALNQRAETVLSVATFIVGAQRDFFEKGAGFLKPMLLKDVAAGVGMHESTVSRVTTNKYLACARGVFELKSFFSKALESAGGAESRSANAVKERICELIRAETPQNVLSDEDLVVLLKREGVDIARRTVAKYRDAAGIPTSARRKREKRLKT